MVAVDNATIAFEATAKGDQQRDLRLACRERPHMVIDGKGQLITLTNGASPTTCHRRGGDDYSFTALQTLTIK